MITKLEAVNYLLDVLGSTPVGDLETLHPDLGSALSKLQSSSGTVQKVGMWYNKEIYVELTPNEITKEIALSNDCIKVIGIYGDFVIQRGLKLYDTQKNTYQFDCPVFIDYVVDLEWDYLPQSVQDAIKFHAAMQIASIDLEDQVKYAEQRALYVDAYVQVKAEDLEIKQRNVLLTPKSIRTRGRVQPYRLRSGGGFDVTRPGG